MDEYDAARGERSYYYSRKSGCWAAVARAGRGVVARAQSVRLSDARLVVVPSRQREVIASRTADPACALVVGVASREAEFDIPRPTGLEEVAFSPYRWRGWVWAERGEPVELLLGDVYLAQGGSVWARHGGGAVARRPGRPSSASSREELSAFLRQHGMDWYMTDRQPLMYETVLRVTDGVPHYWVLTDADPYSPAPPRAFKTLEELRSWAVRSTGTARPVSQRYVSRPRTRDEEPDYDHEGAHLDPDSRPLPGYDPGFDWVRFRRLARRYAALGNGLSLRRTPLHIYRPGDGEHSLVYGPDGLAVAGIRTLDEIEKDLLKREREVGIIPDEEPESFDAWVGEDDL